VKLTKFQSEEISKYWFDLSKLTLLSLVLKLFEPSKAEMNLISILTIISGLILAGCFASMGILFSGKVKK
jgi:hypothetical protein